MDMLTCRRSTSDLIKGEESTYAKMKNKKKAAKCRICNRVCFYCYYGILSCEGCKQFFRRAIMKHKYYKCWQNNKQNCDILNDAGVNCRRCRLKKCLLAGMEPGKVILTEGTDGEEHKKFVEKMKEWQQCLLQGENVQIENLMLKLPESLECQFVQKLIDQLRPIERAHKKIWDSTLELPREYTDRHSTLASFLADSENFLSKANKYSMGPLEFYNKAEIIGEIEANGLFLMQKLMRAVERDWFLAVAIARAMPFFKRLEIEDQINLLKYIAMPFPFMISSYYSHAMCAKTLTRANGFKAITILEPKQYKNDPKIQRILKVSLCNLVERMAELALEYREFLLLMAIFLANTNAENLSPSGRDLLYQEAVKYSNALLKMLQTKFGSFSGSERFAALMTLINDVWRAKNAQMNYTVYMEVFYERKDPRQFFAELFYFCLS